MNFEYSVPEIKDEPGKPYAFPNKPFPYQLLPNDRRFEELIYSIYKQEIENNSFAPFDSIQILKGIKDQGRDCSLHTKGRNTGLIQCKWYNSQLKKPECIKEILKFVLYYIIDTSLITEIEDFTYYFVAANGFSDDTQKFLLNFNSEVLKETKLSEWTSTILKKPSFKNINEKENTFKKLSDILSKLKVSPINTQDLDLRLSKAYNSNIIRLFFEVKTDFNSYKEYKKQYSDKSEIPISNILNQLKVASISLLSCKNHFEGLLDSNISREETRKLYNWIINPIKLESDSNICQNTIILAGNAGSGKTVILKDLYTKLLENNIPALGLKADKLYVNNIKELQDKINIEDSIYKILNSLKEEYPIVVLIIDQIDALSQSLSAKREYMDTYIQLINSLSQDNKIRIILSVRIFDLNYDPSLRLYKNNSSVLVQELTDTQIDSVLGQLRTTKSSISTELYLLLRTPNQLDVFCRIYKQGNSYLSIKNIQDLYLELWKVKVLDATTTLIIDSQKVIRLIFSIAETMNESQKISIPELLFIDNYYKELNYLKSENLIKLENDQIQFFHQSFYDYVFAKQFIESGKSILGFLKKNQQSISIRSSYKMLINYLYIYDFKKYVKIISHILLSGKFRYHIKLLSLNTIGFLENPKSEDKILVRQIILSNEHYKRIFLESVISGGWLIFLAEEKELDKLLVIKKTHINIIFKKIQFYRNKTKIHFLDFIKVTPDKQIKEIYLNIWFGIMIRHLQINSNFVLSYLSDSPEFKNKNHIVFQMLYYLKNWSNDKAYALFEKFREIKTNDRHIYFKILEDIVDYRPGYVFNKLHDELLNSTNDLQIRNNHDDFQIEKIIKKLLANESELTLKFLLEIIIEKVKRNKLEGSSPFLDDDLLLPDSDRCDNHKSRLEKLLSLAINKYEEFALSNKSKFIEIFDNYKDTNYESVIRFLISGLMKATDIYSEQVYTLLIRLNYLNTYKEWGKLQYLIRKLIRSTFSYFQDAQKENLLQIILGIKEDEKLIYNDSKTGMKRYYLSLGKTKFLYLRCIDESYINSKSIAKKVFLELQRKNFHLDKDDKYYSSIVTRGIPAPIPSNACIKMSLNNWYQSMVKYNSFIRDLKDNLLTGNLVEHSRTFSDEVKRRPDFFVNFIENIIDDLKINELYIIRGLEGLIEANYNTDKMLKLFKKTLLRIAKPGIIYDRHSDNTINMVRMSRYFIDSRNIDEEVLNFLIVSATSHPDPSIGREIKEDKISVGINSVRGESAHTLTMITNLEFKKAIFDALFKIAKKDSNSVKAAIIYQLAYLMNIDKEKTIELFLLLMQDANINLYKPSIWTVQYLANYNFSKLHSYFENAMDISEVQEDISVILFHAWVRDEVGSKQLFERVLAKSIKSKGVAITVAFRNFYNNKGEPETKYLKILYRYLNSNNKEIADAYNTEFLHADNLKFKDLLPFLKKYSRSQVCKVHPSYFLEYLFKQSKSNPIECFNLLLNLNIVDSKENAYSNYIQEETVKLVIGIYNSLRDSNKNKRDIKRVLNIIDKMLKLQKYRDEANKAIEVITT